MTQRRNKERELFLLREFLGREPRFRGFEPQERERPDFSLSNASTGELIGIELTEYFQGDRDDRGSVARRTERICLSLRKRIGEGLRRISEELSHRSGLIYFSCHGEPVPKKDFEGFVSELASILRSSDPTQRSDLEDHPEPSRRIVSRYISELSISRVTSAWFDSFDCGNCMAGMLGVTEDEIEDVLTSKLGLAAEYRANGFQRVVLLVVAAGDGIAASAGLGYNLPQVAARLRPLIESLGFDEIYFYSRDDGAALRLFPPAAHIRDDELTG